MYEKSGALVIGCEFLLSRIPLRMVPLRRPARIMPVTRIEQMTEMEMVAVPRGAALPEGFRPRPCPDFSSGWSCFPG